MYLERYYAKKNMKTLNYVLKIIFSEFVILFPHDLTLSHMNLCFTCQMFD